MDFSGRHRLDDRIGRNRTVIAGASERRLGLQSHFLNCHFILRRKLKLPEEFGEYPRQGAVPERF